MGFSRRTLAIATVVIILLGALGGIYIRLKALQAEDEGGEIAETDENQPEVESAQAFGTEIAIPVSAGPVLRDTMVLSVSAAGQAQAYARALLISEVEGPVTEVLVHEGDFVRRGQVLARVDPERYEFELERARARLEQAQANFAELTLFDEEIADEALRTERRRMARAKSGLTETEVAVREAELNVRRATVRAPFAGNVANMAIVPGERVVAQRDSIAEIVDISRMRIEVQALETGPLPGERSRCLGNALCFPGHGAAGPGGIDQPGDRPADANGSGDGHASQPGRRGEAGDVCASTDRGASLRQPNDGAAWSDPRARQPHAGVRVRGGAGLARPGKVDVRHAGSRERGVRRDRAGRRHDDARARPARPHRRPLHAHP